jgi:hypothetical protein
MKRLFICLLSLGSLLSVSAAQMVQERPQAPSGGPGPARALANNESNYLILRSIIPPPGVFRQGKLQSVDL